MAQENQVPTPYVNTLLYTRIGEFLTRDVTTIQSKPQKDLSRIICHTVSGKRLYLRHELLVWM